MPLKTGHSPKPPIEPIVSIATSLMDVARKLDSAARAVLETGITEETSPDFLRELGQVRDQFAYLERMAAEKALDLGFTQRAVSGQLGVSTSAVNRWNQNRIAS